MTRYVLDTNIFVHADRDPTWAAELAAFYLTFLPVTYLHAVVVQEFLLGATSPRQDRALYQAYVAPFEDRKRVLTPSYSAWRRSGQVVATLVQRRRLSPGGFSRSFLNDVLDRRLGIPITLGIVLLEVGWRLDLPLQGRAVAGGVGCAFVALER